MIIMIFDYQPSPLKLAGCWAVELEKREAKKKRKKSVLTRGQRRDKKLVILITE